MDHHQFDWITRLVASNPSRRTLAGAIGVVALGIPGIAVAKKNKKKIKKNGFGRAYGRKYFKNGGQRCSGICQGKRDKKKCQAHDQSTCANGQQEDFCGGTDVACVSTSGEGAPAIPLRARPGSVLLLAIASPARRTRIALLNAALTPPVSCARAATRMAASRVSARMPVAACCQ